MDKILISACLLGAPVRYDGKGKLFVHPLIERWQSEGRLVSFCPELAGGFQTPRPPAEIAEAATGDDVLAGEGRVVDDGGADVTAMFVDGAREALAKARAENCRFALLIDGSPSCGSLTIYDGQFSGQKHAGMGVTAALLASHGVNVFAPQDIGDLAALLEK